MSIETDRRSTGFVGYEEDLSLNEQAAVFKAEKKIQEVHKTQRTNEQRVEQLQKANTDRQHALVLIQGNSECQGARYTTIPRPAGLPEKLART